MRKSHEAFTHRVLSTPTPVTSVLDSRTLQPGTPFSAALAGAIDRRVPLIAKHRTDAVRIFSGDSEGAPGIFIDLYGPGAAMMVYDGRTPRGLDSAATAHQALALLKPLGITAIYLKPFPKDRPKLGGELPACVTDSTPAAGEPLPESVIIREVDWNLEVRLYDGLSTGLFLDQRENRAALANAIARRAAKGVPPTVLNTFAYTCAFSVATAKAGAITTSVDVSGRYLDWGKRNFAHNNLDAAQHRFAKMDTFEFFSYAKRKGLTYDLIILDPPSFAAGSKKKGIKSFSSVADYARLIAAAKPLLNEGGAIFASTNTQELCRPVRPRQPLRLELEIAKGLGLPPGRTPDWIKLPPPPQDFAMEKDRFAARFFTLSHPTPLRSTP